MKRVFVGALTLVLCMAAFGCTMSNEPVAPATTVTTTTTTVGSTTPADLPPGLDPDFEVLLLVNGTHALSADYTPDLVSVPARYLNGNLNQVDRQIYPYLIAMLEAAWADGVKLYVRSPYRSYATQRSLYNNKVNGLVRGGMTRTKAEVTAARFIARPGTSEHQSGLAIDFNVADSEFEQLPACAWMKEHAADYGFIMRYPADKADITGVIYEPWHWRFVGINTAKEINRLGVTLEEYLVPTA